MRVSQLTKSSMWYSIHVENICFNCKHKWTAKITMSIVSHVTRWLMNKRYGAGKGPMENSREILYKCFWSLQFRRFKLFNRNNHRNTLSRRMKFLTSYGCFNCEVKKSKVKQMHLARIIFMNLSLIMTY